MSSEGIKIQMYKSATTVLLFVAVCLALFETTLSAAPLPSSECIAWRQIAQNLSRPKRFYNVQCDNNPDDSNCAQLRCSGVYTMQLWFSGNGQGINVSFCFGLYMNHCDSPVSMDYTLLMPNYNVSVAQRITHGSSVKIPGLSFPYRNLGRADVYLFFSLEKNSNSSSINFSITAKVLVKVGFVSDWPSTLQKVLFPPTAIPVPPCNSTSYTNTPTRVPPTTCSSMKFTTEVPPATVSHANSEKRCELGLFSDCDPNEICKEKEGFPGSFVCVCSEDSVQNSISGSCEMKPGSYGQGCELGIASNCGPNQMCQGKQGPGRNGVCLCKDGFHHNPENNICEVNQQAISTDRNNGSSVTVASQQVQTASSGFQVTPLIIGATVGGLVVVVAIIGVIIFLGRRRRQARYQNRQLLLSNEDDEEDDDVNVNI